MGAPDTNVGQITELEGLYDGSELFFSGKPSKLLPKLKQAQQIICRSVIEKAEVLIQELDDVSEKNSMVISDVSDVDELAGLIRDDYRYVNGSGKTRIVFGRNSLPHGVDRKDVPNAQAGDCLLHDACEGIHKLQSAHPDFLRHSQIQHEQVSAVKKGMKGRIGAIFAGWWGETSQDDKPVDHRLFASFFEPVIAYFGSKGWILDGEIVMDNSGIPVEFTLVKQGMSAEGN